MQLSLPQKIGGIGFLHRILLSCIPLRSCIFTLYPVVKASLCSSALRSLQSLDDGVLGTNITDFTLSARLFFILFFLTFFVYFLLAPAFLLFLNHDVLAKILVFSLASKEDSADL